MVGEQEWLSSTAERAENGDAMAILDLAFVYQRGRLVQKDVKQAEILFRQAELTLGEDAWVEILRMFYWERDSRIHSVFREKGQTQSGMACYIYGNYLEKIECRIKDAIEIYMMGKEKMHVGCSLVHHRLTFTGVWKIVGFPILAKLLIEGVIIAMRDENDDRWKT